MLAHAALALLPPSSSLEHMEQHPSLQGLCPLHISKGCCCLSTGLSDHVIPSESLLYPLCFRYDWVLFLPSIVFLSCLATSRLGLALSASARPMGQMVLPMIVPRHRACQTTLLEESSYLSSILGGMMGHPGSPPPVSQPLDLRAQLRIPE